MGAPGTGVGRGGVWKAGVEVDPSALSGYRLKAEASLTFAGAATYQGAFAFEGTATTGFAGRSGDSGQFSLEAVGELGGWLGVEFAFGIYTMEATASLEFTGFTFTSGSFVLEAVADLEGFDGFTWFSGEWNIGADATLGFAGFSSFDSAFSLEANADFGFAGIAEQFGALALEATAELRIIWMPEFCPGGAATAGCDTGVSDVYSDQGAPSTDCDTDQPTAVGLEFPSSTLSSRKDC